VATWYAKAETEIREQTLVTLIEKLAHEWPRYVLPPATASHTRHYVPIGQVKDGVERTAKVFDTFVHTGSGVTLSVIWPNTTLPSEHAAALELLLSRMGYLGRAESWVQFKALSNSEIASLTEGDQTNTAVPLAAEQQLAANQEVVRVLCPLTTTEIASWRSRAFEQQLEDLLKSKQRAAEAKGRDPSKIKLTKADKDGAAAMYPKDLMEALQVHTGDLHRQGWNEAPGSRWVDYARPRDALGGAARRPAKASSRGALTAARFAVASQVPPRLTDALPVAARLRQALMSHSNASPVFLGKDENGTPLKGNRHTYVLPEAYGEHGRLSHVTLFAPMGFDDAARRALEAARRLWSKSGHSLQLVLLGIGVPEDFAGLKSETGQCPLFAASTTWISRTPFIPTRHPKTTRSGTPKLDAYGLQIGSAQHDLRRLLSEAGHPPPVSIESVANTILGGKPTPWLQFKTLRPSGGGSRATNSGFGFRIRFAVPVSGPIAIGYGAHFGLGMFIPVSG
jgi:CRISPR-associated protein Csb2